MPWKAEARLQNIIYIVISLLLAMGVWYVVVGSGQVDGQFEVRLDYRGLPDGLIILNGQAAKAEVRLRGSAELMRNINPRDLSYTVNLSEVQRGANVRSLNLDELPELRAFEVLEVSPARLVLEVEQLVEKTLPIEISFTPLPEASPLHLSATNLDPAMALAQGPASRLSSLESLSAHYDLTRDMTPGSKAINVAITAPDMVKITPPLSTLRYTLALNSTEIKLLRPVQLGPNLRSRFDIEPEQVELTVEVPEASAEDAAYLAAVRVIARPSENLFPGESEDTLVMVMLPQGAHLTSLQPPTVNIRRKSLLTLPQILSQPEEVLAPASSGPAPSGDDSLSDNNSDQADGSKQENSSQRADPNNITENGRADQAGNSSPTED